MLISERGVAPSNGWSAVGGQTQSAYIVEGFYAYDSMMGQSVRA